MSEAKVGYIIEYKCNKGLQSKITIVACKFSDQSKFFGKGNKKRKVTEVCISGKCLQYCQNNCIII